MGINNFGFSFFVAIVFIIASLPNNANSAVTRITKRVWPADLHLDASHWNNSCSLSWSNIQGHKMQLPDALHKVQLIVDPLVLIFNSSRSTVLNIHDDKSQLEHKYKKTMPQFNKTLPVKKLLRDIHKSVQQYVGLFHALSSQYRFIDSLKQNSTKEISTELYYFLNESKLLLCEIETTLNVSRQPVPYLTRDEMKQKIFRMANYLEKDSLLIELDAFYSKKFFYNYVVDLAEYLKVQIAKMRKTSTKALNKKSSKSKEKHNMNRKMNIRKTQGLNNSNGSESSSAMSPQKNRKNRPGSSEKNRNNNKLNNNNSNNSSNLSKKKKIQENGKQRHRHTTKPTSSTAASI